MLVKGAAVISTKAFVESKYEEELIKWLSNLPEESQKIYTQTINESKWYPLNDAFVVPTRVMLGMFYNNDLKGAYELGSYSAEKGLTGIYKVFVKMESPAFIISRAAKVFSAYYKDSSIKVLSNTKKSVILMVDKFPEYADVVEHRIIGWMDKALKISGCENVKTQVVHSFLKGDPFTEFFITWD
ncbi:MAG: hypothetical protein J7L46_01195 [Bacteroidales bacterium]|nr:hypothetical protein [Bacteroidales bacterium]